MLTSSETVMALHVQNRQISAAPTVEPVCQPQSWYGIAKVPIDFVLALAILVLTAPLMILAILAVKLTSRGAVFYSQVRLGLNGVPYTVYKIRTMTQNCEQTSGACWSQQGDPRVTSVGAFLRATHIDELPQLWNILRGDMSLIGPRPERPEFVASLEKAVFRYRERLGVRPGITGLAQVQLPPDSDLDGVRRKVAYDLYYLENLGFWLDFRILCSTALVVLRVRFQACRILFALPSQERVQRAYTRNNADETALHQTLPESRVTRGPAPSPTAELESA